MQQAKSAKKSLRPQSQRLVLEPRIVFDAVIPVMGAEAIEHIAEHTAAETSHTIEAPAFQPPALSDTHINENANALASDRALIDGTLAPSNLAAKEIIFIDAIVADLQQYITDHPNADIVLLDANRDGLEQIAATLAGRTGIESVHILSHGSAAQLNLGNSDLNLQSILGKHADELATIKAALADNADILIYGCNVGAGDAGQAFINALATATGADIAASTDLTGAAAKGGNWVLESTTGQIEMRSIVATGFDGTLAAAVIATPADSLVLKNAAGTVVTTGATGYTGANSAAVGQGAVATWVNAGAVGAQAIDLRATVVTLTAGDNITFNRPTAANNDPGFVINDANGAGGASALIRWEIFLTGTNTLIAGDVNFTVADIDGVGGAANTRESLQVSTNTLSSYTLAATTDIAVSTATPGIINISGTQNETANPPTAISAVKLSWTNTASFDITYGLVANSATGAGFSHDGNSQFAITGAAVSIPRIDLDGDNSSGTASNTGFQTTFTEDGAAKPIVDTDVTITNPAGNVTTAVITLKNAQLGDVLNIGSLAGLGITATTDTSVGGVIKITLTGSTTAANYQTALKLITFSNPSQSPATVDRNVDVYFGNGTFTSNVASTVITVLSVNDAPAGADKTIPINEDATSYIVTSADFGFTDPVDSTPNTFAGVLVTNLPATTEGIYTLNGVAISIGQVIAVTDINASKLIFTPAANSNGAAIGALGFKVQDNGGILNGGINTDPIANTLQFNIAAINDAPVNIVPIAQSTPEDTAKIFSTAIGNAIQISDVDAGTGIMTVTIWAENGTLTLSQTTGLTFSTTTNSTAVSDGTDDETIRITGTIADINAALNGLVFKPTANLNNNATVAGAALGGKITIRTDDNGNSGGPNLSDTDSVVINITPVKDTAIDNVITNEDTPIVISPFTNDSFGAGNAFLSSVTSPSNGTAVVNAGTGTTTYTPNANFNGTDSYTYTTTTIDRGFNYEFFSVNPPDSNSYTGTFPAGFPTTAANGFGWVAGISGLDGLRIQEQQNDTDGTLVARLSGVALIEQAGNYTFNLSVDNVARLIIDGVTVIADANYSSAGTATIALTAGLHTFQVQYADVVGNEAIALTYSGLDTGNVAINVNNDKHWGAAARTETETINITINPTIDAPAGTDKTITINEDTPYTVTAGDFGFSDPNDAPANTFTNVIIGSSLPPASEGIYKLNGIAIAANQVISVADINAGKLTFTPAANVNTIGVATLGAINFQVQDNGGGATSTPSNTDQTPNVLNFKVTPVDDVVTISGNNNGTVAGTDAQVNESDLASGSNPAGTGETATGTFTLGPSASLTSLTINGGATITLTQLTASGTTPIVRTGSNGTLTISGYNATTGVVNYSYLLTSAADHTGNVIKNDTFAIVTTDVENQTASGSLAINILDDAPIAANDVDNTVNTPANPSSIAYGNVINASNTGAGGGTDPNNQDGVADIIGADVNANPVTLVSSGTGTYGTLVLNSNGSYSYTPSFANTAVSGLLSPSTLTDSFTYRITDGDGDSTTATITITIVPSPAITGLGDGTVAGTDGSVLESDLAAGTNAAGTGETLVGSFNLFTGAATLAVTNALTIGTTTVSLAQLIAASTTNIAVTGTSFGALNITNYDVLTGVVTYSYTLSAAQTHGTPQESVNLVVRDSIGNSGTGTLKIDIKDDAPIAAADVNSVTETGTVAGTSPIAGNVFTNDKIGADGVSVTPAGPVTGVKAGAGSPANTGINTGVLGSYGTLTLQANGSYSYVLDNANTVVNALKAGQTLTETYTYKITDSDGDETSTTLTITINGANDAPTANPNTYSMNEDALPITLNPLIGDTDPDGDTLRITDIAGTPIVAGTAYTIAVTNGTVNVSAGGIITFTPAAQFNGAVTFAYTVSDPSGATSTANQTINVAPVNDAPTASPDTGNTNEEVTLVVNAATGLLANDSDIDTGNNTGLTVTQFTIAGVPGTFTAGSTAAIPGKGSLLINTNGSYTFTPAANFNGAVPVVTYTVSDNGSPAALTATSTLTLTVNPVNDAPSPVDDTKTSPEDTTLNVNAATGLLANDNDIDTGNNTGLTVTQFSLDGITFFAAGTTQTIAGKGDITINGDGSYSFVPVANFNGTVPAITYRVSDNDPTTPLTATARLNITITPVNDAPVAIDDGTAGSPLPIVEDTPTTLNLLGNDTDPDGDILSVKSINGTLLTPGTAQTINVPNGTVKISAAGVISFTPAPNYNGPVAFDYVVQDGKGGEDTGTVNLNVTPVNDAPVSAPDTNTTPEDTPVSGNVLTNDSDVDAGNTLSVTQFVVNGSTVTVPTGAVGGSITIAAGTINVKADGSYTFTPALNFNGAVPVITYTVADNGAPVLTSTNTLTLTVTPVNDPPQATATTATGGEDTPIAVSLAGTDVDGTVVSVTVPTLPSVLQGVLYLADGTTPVDANTPLTPAQAAGLIFKPAPNFNGTVTIPFVVTDNSGAVSAAANAVITVSDINDAPVAVSKSVNSPEDVPVTVNLTGTDVDGTILGVTVTQLPTTNEGILYFADRVTPVQLGVEITPAQAATLVFIPVLDYNSTIGNLVDIRFTVRDDDNANSIVGTFIIDVTAVNDDPVATGVTVPTTPEDTPVTFQLPGTDTEDDPLSLPLRVSISVLPPANQGIIYLADGITKVVAGIYYPPGNFIFVPAPNFNGSVSAIPYTVKDSKDQISAPANVILSVNVVNDAPDPLPDTNTILEDAIATGNVLPNDTDPENDALNVTQFTIAGVGTFAANSVAVIANVGSLVINADGSYVFTPVANYNGTVPVATYTVSDGNLTSTSTLSITVTPVNDAPVAVSSNATGNEDTPINVGLTATDVDGTIASISVTTLPTAAQGVLYYADGVTPVSTTTPLTPAQAATLKFVPTLNFNGTVTIPFTATDNNSAVSVLPGTFTININPVNDLPVATPITTTTPEDTPVTVGLIGSDVEDPANALITKVTTLPALAQGILYLADGVTPVVAGSALTNAQAAGLIFKPAPNFNGSVTIPFTVTDTNGGVSTSANAVISITPVNDNPVAVTDNYTMNEDGAPITLAPLTADSDVDGNPLTISNIAGTPIVAGTAYTIAVTGGTVSVSTAGVITFTPTPNFNGVVTFPYTINDGQGGTATANQVITVNTVNDPPVATAYAITAAEDAVSVNVSLVGTDVEDGTPNIVKVSTLPPASQGILYLANGTTPVIAGAPLTAAQAAGLIFKPTLNFNGTVTIPFTVTDSNGATSAPANAVLTITDVNDPPVAVSASRNTLEDAQVPVTLAANDVDGTVVGITVTQLPAANEGVLYFAGGTVPVALGVEMTPAQAAGLVFIPVLDYNSSAGDLVEIKFTARDDDNGISLPGSFVIDVAGLNDDPIATPSSGSTPEDTPVVLTFTGTDIEDGVATSVSIVTLPPASQGILTLTDGTPVVAGVDYPPGSFIFTPALNYNGAVNAIPFTVKDSAGQVSSPPSLVTVTIVAVNDAPVPAPDAQTIAEDTTATGNVLSNDIDLDSPVLSVTQFVVNGTTVTVPPGAVGGSITIAEGTINVKANGSYSFTPTANFNGNVPQVTYTVSDASGTPTATATSTLDIMVTPVNDPPVATPITATGNEDAASIPVSLLGTDVDNLAADLITTVSALPPAAQGVLYLADGVTPVLAGQPLTAAQAAGLIFVPAPNFNGTVNIPFTVKDPSGAISPSVNATIIVNAVNDPPVANNGTFAGLEDAPLSFGLTGSDTEGPVTAYNVTSLPDPITQGTVYLADGVTPVTTTTPLTPAQAASLVFIPVNNFFGTATLTFTVTDNQGAVSPAASIALQISDVIQPPVATPVNISASSEKPIAISLGGTDADGFVASVTVQSLPPASQGLLTLADGTPVVAGVALTPAQAAGLIFKPVIGFNGTVQIPFFLTDDEGNNSTVAFATIKFSDSNILFEQLGTQRNPFGDGLDPNRPDPFALRSPVIPIGMPEDLFVTNSVRESAMRIAQNSGFGVFNVDAPTRGELDNLTYDLKGLPVGMDNTLFVQHAVRSLPITQEPRLFVQNAVRQSQLESTMRNIGTNSFNSATAGVSSLLSPFDLGSPNDAVDLSVDGVNSDFAKKSVEATNQPKELALDANSESVVDKDFSKLESLSDKATDATAKEVSAKLLEKQLPAEAKKVAAASFASQLNAASKKIKASDIFNKSN